MIVSRAVSNAFCSDQRLCRTKSTDLQQLLVFFPYTNLCLQVRFFNRFLLFLLLLLRRLFFLFFFVGHGAFALLAHLHVRAGGVGRLRQLLMETAPLQDWEKTNTDTGI